MFSIWADIFTSFYKYLLSRNDSTHCCYRCQVLVLYGVFFDGFGGILIICGDQCSYWQDVDGISLILI